jgi:hypothetical protein
MTNLNQILRVHAAEAEVNEGLSVIPREVKYCTKNVQFNRNPTPSWLLTDPN